MSLENKFSCPVCSNNSCDTLIDFGYVPRSGIFLSHPEEKSPSTKLKFDFCTNCALISLNTDNFVTSDYTEVSRTTSHQLPNYASEIVNYLNYKLNKRDFIIEIGANDGAFLDILKGNGFVNLLGIEPSADCSKILISKDHKVENSYFNSARAENIMWKYGKADAVICRHTLEHIPHPRDFLISIKKIAKENCLTFIETPNSQEITEKNLGHELWDEHLYYFSKRNLELLAKNLNFNVDKVLVYPHLMTSNILLFSDGFNKGNYYFEKTSRDILDCKNFSLRWKIFCDRLNLEIEKSPKPIFGIGASHPQSNFFIFSGIGNYIECLIDDDINKIGKYSPLPKTVRIISSKEYLERDKPGTLLLTAFGYNNWMKKICDGSSGVKILNPYEIY
jgi:hypothetical protein